VEKVWLRHCEDRREEGGEEQEGGGEVHFYVWEEVCWVFSAGFGDRYVDCDRFSWTNWILGFGGAYMYESMDVGDEDRFTR